MSRTAIFSSPGCAAYGDAGTRSETQPIEMVATPQTDITNAKAASRRDIVEMLILKVNLSEIGLSNVPGFSSAD